MTNTLSQRIRANPVLAKGFTMIELVVVIGIIGVLVLILTPTIAGNKTSSTATLIPRMADAAMNNWQAFANEAGVTTAVASNPAFSGVTNGSAERIIFAGGEDNVATSYKTAYTRSGIKPLSSMVSEGSTAGQWVMSGTTDMRVTVTGGGTTPLTLEIANVPEEVILLMAQKIRPDTASLTKSGADIKVGNLTYNVASSGTSGTVKFVK